MVIRTILYVNVPGSNKTFFLEFPIANVVYDLLVNSRFAWASCVVTIGMIDKAASRFVVVFIAATASYKCNESVGTCAL